MSVKKQQAREVVQIRARTQGKIDILIRTLFPDIRLIWQPIEMFYTDGYEDTFTTMEKLERVGYFLTPENRKFREKRRIATEAALYMLYPRVETYITANPGGCRLSRIMEAIGPWYSLKLAKLREIKDEVIAMHSEGYPLD